MADRHSRTEVLKRLSDGKALCSEMNNASSNANFLYMRRHDALVMQLESAKQSLVGQNQRAQNEMKKKLEKYKQRKRVIFRTRISKPRDDKDGEEDDVMSRNTSRARSSSIGETRSCQSGYSGNSSVRLPSILNMSVVSTNSDDRMSSGLSRYSHNFHRLKRQESMHFQVLSSRVYDFCTMMDAERTGSANTFFITQAKRHIAFKEAKARSRASSGVTTSSSRVSSGKFTKGKPFRENHRVVTAVAT